LSGSEWKTAENAKSAEAARIQASLRGGVEGVGGHLWAEAQSCLRAIANWTNGTDGTKWEGPRRPLSDCFAVREEDGALLDF